MDKQIALVTGANRGIGLEVARQLGNRGIVVLVGAREKARAQSASETLRKEGIDARPVLLDVVREEHIRGLVSYLTEEFGHLDILVNNAAVALDGSDSDSGSRELMRRTYEVNVIAPYAVTRALKPLLKRSPGGRVVNHSSIIGSITVMGTNEEARTWAGPAYASSKAALNMLTVLMATKMFAGTLVKVNSAHPGWVKTDLGGPNAPMNAVDGAKTAVALATLAEDGPTGGFFHVGEALPW
jgi:NAD(P)-dependent dehydrogenase (short-subunit alcohol dehydrogenase family)